VKADCYHLLAILAAVTKNIGLQLGQISDTSTTWSHPMSRLTVTSHTYVEAGNLAL